jgi:SAM-dependent methyltransferase
MTDASPADQNSFEDANEISDHGERVSHLVKDFTFYGHLSIYDFAKQFCRGAVVLDAGSGSGYGTAHLAEAGARQVYGIDVSTKAIAFSRHHFDKPNLEFTAADLQNLPFPAGFFDFVYTSNTLEHVPDVLGFLRAAHTSLKPSGALLVAVPPITDDRLTYLNLINRHHVNIWSPRQWQIILGQFFGEVEVFLHGVGRIGSDFAPTDAPITERDFVFAPGSVADMYRMFTLTAIFVVKAPRSADVLPRPTSSVRFIDESFTRAVGYIDPKLKSRLRSYFEPSRRTPDELVRRAWAVWRVQGTRTVLRRAIKFLTRFEHPH